jgi:hypothetical protein
MDTTISSFHMGMVSKQTKTRKTPMNIRLMGNLFKLSLAQKL